MPAPRPSTPDRPVLPTAVLLAAGLALLLVSAGVGAAQDRGPSRLPSRNEPDVPEKAGKVLFARRADLPIILDGRLDEAAWARADSIEDLLQLEPDNMRPASERTVVRVLYDERHLYVGFVAHDRDPARIAAGLVRRDDPPPADLLYVGFDPRHDHLTGYVFSTTPRGVQRDWYFYDDQVRDLGYDAVWEVAAAVTAHGWTAEFRIPFAQMRFTLPAEGRMVWGFDVRRDIFRKGENALWVGMPRGSRGVVSRWGHLVFADGLPAPRRLEVMPDTVARRSELPGAASAAHAVDGGMDTRLGLGSAATLAATVNPDFGQVEADPAVLNLTVFETFFPEKRPFFTEDSRVFVPPHEAFQLFHSRRIGQRPGYYRLPATDREVERPEQTTILGAAKLTGKASGWTWGLLTALTPREHVLTDSIAVPSPGDTTFTRRSRLAEPVTSWTAARVQRDVLGGSSNVGAIATAVVREGAADAVTGGVDYKLRWGRNRWQWDGHWALSRAPFPGGTRRTGLGGITSVGYSGKHLGFLATVDHLGPDFRVTDLGFLPGRVNRTGVLGSLQLAQPDPAGPFRRITGFLRGGQAWNGDGLVFEQTAALGATAMFRNFASVGLTLERAFETLDDLDTRGGPPIVRPARIGAALFGNTDSRRTTQLGFDLGAQDDAAGGWLGFAGATLALQAWPALQGQLRAAYTFARDQAQWIENRDADADGTVDHVYGTLHRDVLDLRLRSTYAIHRDLTLQLFLQPFVAVGDFRDIRKLARPHSYEFTPVTPARNYDFNRKTLRGTFVLRWEYLRGSTIYLAWTRSTQDLARPGVFRPFDDLGDALASTRGSNVWLVKATYWWSP